MLTLIFSLLGLLFSTAGGLIILVVIIGGLILQSVFKQNGTNKSPNIKKQDYRYQLINMKTQQIVGAGNDYLEICRKKRELGSGFIIKDTQYVKKKRII
jgi:hypothetical protein